MPETPMDEDRLAARRKHKIGTAGQLTDMQSITVTERVDKPPDNEFGRSILAANPRHKVTALFGSQRVHAGRLGAQETSGISRRPA